MLGFDLQFHTVDLFVMLLETVMHLDSYMNIAHLLKTRGKSRTSLLKASEVTIQVAGSAMRHSVGVGMMDGWCQVPRDLEKDFAMRLRVEHEWSVRRRLATTIRSRNPTLEKIVSVPVLQP